MAATFSILYFWLGKLLILSPLASFIRCLLISSKISVIVMFITITNILFLNLIRLNSSHIIHTILLVRKAFNFITSGFFHPLWRNRGLAISAYNIIVDTAPFVLYPRPGSNPQVFHTSHFIHTIHRSFVFKAFCKDRYNQNQKRRLRRNHFKNSNNNRNKST